MHLRTRRTGGSLGAVVCCGALAMAACTSLPAEPTVMGKGGEGVAGNSGASGTGIVLSGGAGQSGAGGRGLGGAMGTAGASAAGGRDGTGLAGAAGGGGLAAAGSSGAGGSAASGGITGTAGKGGAGGTAGATGAGGTAGHAGATGGAGTTGAGGAAGTTGGSGGAAATGAGGAGSTPCDGLCTSPMTFKASTQVGNLGTGASCWQLVGSTVHDFECGNFVSPRTFAVNGTSADCTTGMSITAPAARNGGYCVQVGAGNYSYAYFTTY